MKSVGLLYLLGVCLIRVQVLYLVLVISCSQVF